MKINLIKHISVEDVGKDWFEEHVASLCSSYCDYILGKTNWIELRFYRKNDKPYVLANFFLDNGMYIEHISFDDLNIHIDQLNIPALNAITLCQDLKQNTTEKKKKHKI